MIRRPFLGNLLHELFLRNQPLFNQELCQCISLREESIHALEPLVIAPGEDSAPPRVVGHRLPVGMRWARYCSVRQSSDTGATRGSLPIERRAAFTARILAWRSRPESRCSPSPRALVAAACIRPRHPRRRTQLRAARAIALACSAAPGARSAASWARARASVHSSRRAWTRARPRLT